MASSYISLHYILLYEFHDDQSYKLTHPGEHLCGTVENIQYCEWTPSVLWRMISTGENIQNFGGCSLLWETPSVPWRVFSTMGGYHHYYRGITMQGYSVLRETTVTVELIPKVLMVFLHSTEHSLEY